MPLPQRAFYTLQEAALRWECSLMDLAGWAAVGKLEIVTAIWPVIQSGHVYAGFVVVPVAEILGLFGGEVAQDRVILRRIRPLETEGWVLIESDDHFFTLCLGDLIIMVEEMHRFETEHGLMRRVTINNGAPSRYDWEGLFAAMIHRVHVEGVPATQGEWITEAQDWFAQRSGGETPDERTIRRRLGPIWKSLQEDA